jgi:hypothetical protein
MNLEISKSFREIPYIEEILMLKSGTLERKRNNMVLVK